MILRVLILLLLIYLVLRFVRSLQMLNRQRKPDHAVDDVLVPCATCGTYNFKKQALLAKDKYYCNDSCFKKMME